MNAHPTAIVDPKSDMADDVKVGAYSVIEGDVRIGPGTIIAAHCFIGSGTSIGANNRLYFGAQVGAEPQDIKHLEGTIGVTIVGNGNTFREYVTVSSSTVCFDGDTGRATRIGDGCLFMASTHVAHDCTVGNGVVMANNSALGGHVAVEDAVTIGGLTAVHQHCRIGAYAFVGAMSYVNKDILPYMLVRGNPCTCYGPNLVGLRRHGFSTASIHALKHMYRLLYRSQLNTTQAIDAIEAEVADCEEKRRLLEFLKTAQRGISK